MTIRIANKLHAVKRYGISYKEMRNRFFAAAALVLGLVLGTQVTQYAVHIGEHAAQAATQSTGRSEVVVPDQVCVFCASIGVPSTQSRLVVEVVVHLIWDLHIQMAVTHSPSILALQLPPSTGPPARV